MGKIEAETCSVCKENTSKYRCPGCAAPYCSLACNKTHKAGGGVDGPHPPCTGKRVVPNSSQKQAGGQSNSGQSLRKRPRGGGDYADATAPTTTACVRKGRDQWRGGREDRQEEEWQMSADQRDRISRCSWLKVALRDPKLQGLLAEIDQAPDPEKALAFHRTNTQFGGFMDILLLEIDEFRKGGAGEPALVAADP